MQAIVVTFDRLCFRLIGCYGNEWIETPNLDRLAATATVFDNHVTDSVGPRSGTAWLTGCHAMWPSNQEPPALCDLLRDLGVKSHLITANHHAAIQWESARFDRVARVAGQDGLDVTPADVPFAKLIQATGPLFSAPADSEKRLIWLHAPEPGLPPEGFATLYFDDFEERGFALAETPREDWSQQIAVAAGSMSLVDHWLGELLTRIKANLNNQPTLIIITAARGRSWMDDYFAATSGLRSDSPANLLRGHETGCPLILTVIGDDRHADLSGIRSTRFVQPDDLRPTLLDWFGSDPAADNGTGDSLLRQGVSDGIARTEVHFSDDSCHIGIRTSDWNCLARLARPDVRLPATICFGDEDWPEQVQLFAKPEDIWDVTDQSTQQPEVCEALVRKFHQRIFTA